MTDPSQVRPKLVGEPIKRREDPRLLSGRGSFVDDYQVAHVLHVAFRRSDHAHARIAAIDTTTARTMPGVVAVFSAQDLAGTYQPLRATSRMANYYATPLAPLACDKVRYVGEPVVAVIAESRYLAEDAVETITIDFEPLAVEIDSEAAAQEGAPRLHEEAASNVIVAREFKRGDVEAALIEAFVTIKGRFRMHRKTAAAIEPRACLAEYDAGHDALTLYSATQIPGILRDAIAQALELPGTRLRVIAPDVGGGFGGKASLYAEEFFVCLASRKLERPVKWTSDRMEDLIGTSQAFDEIIDAELGFDRAGRLLGLAAEAIGDVGAYSIYPWTAALEPVQVVSFLPGPYRLANYRGRARGVATPKAPTGPYRGVGRPISTFVMERLMDMGARKLGLDPRVIRERNLVAADEFPYKVASGLVWDKSGFRECLTRACQAIGYDDMRARQAKVRANGGWFGIGIACYAELTGIGSRISVAPGMPLNTGTETADIRIDSTGAVRASFGVAAHGQGLETTLSQIIADHLGAGLEDIRIVLGDSAAVASGTGSYASRSLVLAGGAAIRAAEAVREKVIAVASHLLEAEASDLVAAGGRVTVAGTDRSVTFRDIARAVYLEMGRLPPEAREQIAAVKSYDPVFGTTTSATHIAAVEIDPQTYEVRIDRYVVAEDCGRIVNPKIVDGQVHGGVAQGIGAALYEEVRYDAAGQIQTASLVDYLVPAASDVPPMDVEHLDSQSPSLGGYRGMGEGGTIGAPAAIANAIADALATLGVEINELPATPERLFRLIEQAKAAKSAP